MLFPLRQQELPEWIGMHEISLTQSLLDIVEEYACRERFVRVNVLKLSFGRLSCLDAGSLEFAFAVQARGTKAEGARLEFDIRPAVVYCGHWGREATLAGCFELLCPRCSGNEVRLTGGTEELKLLEMDVD
jgi:hydrogenase nickel incorporation protein HypA/HybF